MGCLMNATQDIEALQSRIAKLETFLDRFESFRWKFQCPTCRKSSHPDHISKMPPSEAIVACLRELDRPIGVGVLRKKLEAKGYPMERFGPRQSYYYTLLCRLNGKKIKRLEGDEVMPIG